MIITFSGNNGSGKTRLSSDFYLNLKRMNKKSIYVAEFQYLFLDKIKEIFGKKTLKIQNNVIQERKKTLIAYLIPYLVWLDLFFLFWYLVIFRKNYVIVVDRYALDYLNTWIELGVSNKIIEILYGFFPRPKIKFYIDVDPAIAFRRYSKREMIKIKKGLATKHNLKLSFYKRNRQIYKKIMKNKDFVIINGNQSIGICNKRVMSYFNDYVDN